jgi:hypothetical protein
MKNFILSYIYALFRFSLGLLLHPYQTMQILVVQKTFIWIALMPVIFLGLLIVLSKAVLFPLITFFLSVLTLPQTPLVFALYSFFTTWLVIFVVYWQILLLYLLFRFRLSLSSGNNY